MVGKGLAAAASLEEEARAASARLVAGDWEGYASYFHPEATAEVQEVLVRLAERETDPQRTTPEDVAILQFLGLEDAQRIRSLPADRLLAHFLRRLNDLMAGQGASLIPEAVQVLGVVFEGPELAHA